CVERIRNPIEAARLVMDESAHVYFVGAGAEEFAAAHGVGLIDNSELVLDRERQRLAWFLERERAGFPDLTFAGDDKSPETAHRGSGALGNADSDRDHADRALHLQSHDTVGAVALDSAGNIAAGTSTGGTLGKAPGRVGDSSLIGCGCYADNDSAAVSLTGWGEPIMKLVLGKWAVDRVLAGAAPQQAAANSIAYLHARLAGHGGIILLAPNGQLGVAHNTPRMAWGVVDSDGTLVAITA
ncbi:MAG TPA: isoaspartyl peptidase/L-asparaginase, partial [Acidisarcina sp.]